MNEKEMKERDTKSWWFKKLAGLFKEDDVFWNNEIKANLYVTFVIYLLVAIVLLSWVLTYVGIFELPMENITGMMLSVLPILFLALVLSWVTHGQKKWVKYVLCLAIIYFAVALYSLLSFFVGLVIAVPIILSVRYYSRKFTEEISLLAFIGMFLSEFIYSKYGVLDLNFIYFEPGTVLNVTDGNLMNSVIEHGYDYKIYLSYLFRGSFIPRAMFLVIISVICVELASRAHIMVLEQQEISQKTESVKAELDMATNIQTSVLPKIFPAFPDRPELDIVASMDPAKEVGGDFYDYYLLDDDHLLFLIADVSGKGIPAALFMMVTKILIKTHAYIQKTPAEIAREVNIQLCEDNEEMMFCTAWIGILELSTGIVSAVDCGHEYPYLSHQGGDYELIKGKKSFVLGGMKETIFKEYTFNMQKGDKLFLYTDGVAEATNAENKLYGLDRLKNVLDAHKEDTSSELLVHVREDVDAFVKEAPQFDDITMVALHYKSEMETK